MDISGFPSGLTARHGAVAALCLVLSAPLARADEAQARELFKAMTDYLAAQQALSFDFDSSVEGITKDNHKLTIGEFRQRRIGASRPAAPCA